MQPSPLCTAPVRRPGVSRAAKGLLCLALSFAGQSLQADPRLEAPGYGNISEREFREDYAALSERLAGSHVIPGLHRNFVPQGLEFLEPESNEVVLSGYFCERFSRWWRSFVRHCVQKRSAFYLFDLDAGKAVRLALLEEHSGEPMRRHAGGVALLHGRLWLPDYFQVFRFDLSELRDAPGSVITMRPGNEKRIGVDSSGDFITAFGDMLWIGNFQRGRRGNPLPVHYTSLLTSTRGWTAGYRINPDTLRPESRVRYEVSYGGVLYDVHRPNAALHHGSKVQGMSFLGGKRVVLSASYSYQKSALTFHGLAHPPAREAGPDETMMLPDGSTLRIRTLDASSRQQLVTAPPGAEGIAFNGSLLAVAFEGGALPYRQRWRRLEDRFLLLRPPSHPGQ